MVVVVVGGKGELLVELVERLLGPGQARGRLVARRRALVGALGAWPVRLVAAELVQLEQLFGRDHGRERVLVGLVRAGLVGLAVGGLAARQLLRVGRLRLLLLLLELELLLLLLLVVELDQHGEEHGGGGLAACGLAAGYRRRVRAARRAGCE